MNFYTLTFKKETKPRKWILIIIIFSLIVSFFIVSLNLIVDPYNITKYNILNIKYKFARDDRTEKLRYFDSLDKFDNIMIGSSRVYSINPKIASQLLGGTTYNLGVGTASVEDHLGILKYLERKNKLPKKIIIGIDFYTFNKNIPPNKYFMKNKELNFLSYSNYTEDYLSKLYSIDSFRASFKTLKNHLFNDKIRSRFDHLGWSGAYEDYSLRDKKYDLLVAKKEIDFELKEKYTNYLHIDPKRVEYYEEIRDICKQNNIKLYIFTTPLHPLLLAKLNDNISTKKAMDEFIKYLSTFNNFVNLYYNKLMYNDIRNFYGATHTSINAGDLILQLVLTTNKTTKKEKTN